MATNHPGDALHHQQPPFSDNRIDAFTNVLYTHCCLSLINNISPVKSMIDSYAHDWDLTLCNTH